MTINRNNYEAFFLDYHEGNLSEELKREVHSFVDSNPDLREEFESFEIISLEVKDMRFPGKQQLKKNTITFQNYKTWFVAYNEGDLDDAGNLEVEQFIEVNPGYKPELEILRHTKVLPDYSIQFKGKSILKKGGLVRPMWARVAAAACLAIAILGYWMIQSQPEQGFVKSDEPVKPSAETEIKVQLAEENKTSESISVEKANQEKISTPVKRVKTDLQPAEKLAYSEPVPPLQEKNIAEEPVAANENTTPVSSAPETMIVINEAEKGDAPLKKLVVLDDNDLADLGLIEKTATENNSRLGDAMNGVGKIFGWNTHYKSGHNPLQSKSTETYALGPLAITRTVSR